jgi:hypothetical protein
MDLDTVDSYMCRLCMSEDDVILYSIFDDVHVEESTVSKIWDCLNLKVTVFSTLILVFYNAR